MAYQLAHSDYQSVIWRITSCTSITFGILPI
nr:MAG TPA: hypothetical protein [Caudoviricetes sp.]